MNANLTLELAGNSVRGGIALLLSLLIYIPIYAQCPTTSDIEITTISTEVGSTLEITFSGYEASDIKRIELVKMGKGVLTGSSGRAERNGSKLIFKQLPQGEYMIRLTGSDQCTVIIGSKPNYKGIEIG